MKLITVTSLQQPSDIRLLGKGITILISLSSVKIMQFTSRGAKSDLSNTEFLVANSKIVFFTTYKQCLKTCSC